MFLEIDNIIFPDSCEVIQVASQQYVYPIFKNGSTSLHFTQDIKKWKSFYNNDIKKIQSPITVYLRDPRERFISGVNTFVQHCHKDYSNLDTTTILHFVKHHLFLNRHYIPQFYWLINLSRYFSGLLIFEPLSNINQIVDTNERAWVIPPTLDFLESIKDFPWEKLELYFFLDQILFNYIDHPTTLDKIMLDVKSNFPELYQLIFQKSLDITNVLPKT